MEKEKTEDQINPNTEETAQKQEAKEDFHENVEKIIQDKTPEEKIADLEDKIVRQYAEMENQRRRYEKEKDDAFEYGGFAFAKETLNLIDNLDLSKLSVRFKHSFASAIPPYSYASSFSFSYLLLWFSNSA